VTVSAQTPIKRSTANGVTTVFPYDFKILAAADLEVSLDGVVKTLTTDYTLSGVGDYAGGNVTMLSAPANGVTVVRRRNMAYIREVDYQDQGELPTDTLDDDQDAPILMIQQVAEGLSRAVSLPPESSGVSLELPTPGALQYLRWNAAADALESVLLADVSLISLTAYAQTLLNAVDAAAARLVLGLSAPVTLASAATTDIGGQNSIFVEISGTTGITSLGTNYNGPRFLRFTGSLTLTHNATTLNLPGAANIITVAGATAIAYPNSTGDGWNIHSYHAGLTASSGNNTSTIYTTTGTSTAFVATPNPVLPANSAGASHILGFHVAPTGTPTLAVSGLTALPLKYRDNGGTLQTLTADQAPINWQSPVYTDGTNWILRDIAGTIYAGTAQATTSGKSKDFTGIPAGTKRVTVQFVSVSTNGSSVPIVQMGTSGGVETSGYAARATEFIDPSTVATVSFTNGVPFSYGAAAASVNGQLVFTLQNSATNTWVFGGSTNSATNVTDLVNGSKSLAGALDRIRVTTVNGTDAFDAGSVNILYE